MCNVHKLSLLFNIEPRRAEKLQAKNSAPVDGYKHSFRSNSFNFTNG